MQRWSILLALLFAFPVLAGCLAANDSVGDGASEPGLTPVAERDPADYILNATTSSVLASPKYDILPGRAFNLPVALPATEGFAAATGVATVNLGLFLPDIPGCDWDAQELPEQCRVPVVADIGPYYSASSGALSGVFQFEGDSISTEPANRLGGFLIENLVPQGYAVAQVAVFGTGDSNHCQDLMGTSEQLGINAAVTFLGTQAFSNGNVAAIGRSYDGGTAWEAATFGNPHLKTIVPISGVLGQRDLMWRNGSAEFRGPGLLYALYAIMTPDGDAEDAHVLCEDYLLGGAEGAATYAYMDDYLEELKPYWNEREFLQRTLKNYEGSVYLIHGMQDWNVDNHQAFPAYQMLIDKGLDVKGLFGQWAHHYPDRAGEHAGLPSGFGAEAFPNTVRMDWAQDLLEWFDYYLKEAGPQPELHAEVQDNYGQWRIEPTFPPKDVAFRSLGFGDAEAIHTTPDILFGAQDPVLGTPIVGNDLTYHFGVLDETKDLRIAGNPALDLLVVPVGPGGQVYAELFDATAGLRLGHATMDLRYYKGGVEPQTVSPGQPLRPALEFFAMDVILPAGHELGIRLNTQGMDYLPSPVLAPIQVSPEGSYLRIPIADPSNDLLFQPPTPVVQTLQVDTTTST